MTRICNLLTIIIIIVTFTVVTAKDYCNLQSCDAKGSHTLCRFTSSTPAAACGRSYKVGLSDAEKKAIVDKHNQLRRKVASGQETRGNPGPQPPAVSMPDLIWDSELENIAQRWAIQCNFNHDSCRNVDRFAVGQNIAATFSSGENTSTMESMVQMWYDEVDNFDRNGVFSYTFDPNTGHYTQIVWAETTTIGCGSMLYEENGWNKKYLVCNYGSSGNYLGQEIYKVK